MLRQGGIHGQWDVAVSTANVAERRQPSLRLEGSMTAPISKHNNLITRRSIFVGSAALLIGAPAIVRAISLMPVHSLRGPIGPQYAGFCERLFYHSLDCGLRAGRISTVCNDKIVSAADARRMVAYARAQGWPPPEAP